MTRHNGAVVRPAMKADGDSRDACWSKLDWLDPKWRGTPEDMLAFGLRCRDTKNWWSGITLLCADAHTRYSNFLGNRKADYLASPEVWSDITSVYDEYLKYHPRDHVARSKYASLAYDSRHYQQALRSSRDSGTTSRAGESFPITRSKRSSHTELTAERWPPSPEKGVRSRI